MKFKEIKPGMIIHCPTEEDAKALLEHLYFKENYDLRRTDTTHKYFKIEPDNSAVSSLGGFYSDEVTEFSDLIEHKESQFPPNKIVIEDGNVSFILGSPINSPMTAEEKKPKADGEATLVIKESWEKGFKEGYAYCKGKILKAIEGSGEDATKM